LDTPSAAPRGYGVEAELLSPPRRSLGRAETAFDVLPTWTTFPRFGFVADFGPDRPDVEQAMETLAKFHLNGLQFYDWQYRHEILVAPQEEYLDPLGRRLSLATVRGLIGAADRRGMASMGYLAVYAASAVFWREHPDWALYDASGKAIPFGEEFLGLMDPTPGTPWVEHLFGECGRALADMGFQGLHIDQYGQPRQAWNASGDPVDLPGAFHAFISEAKRRWPEAAITFNAVEAWPMQDLAAAPQDFAYLELWPSTPTYRELRQIISDARRQSGGKGLVLALYVPADRPANIRLADALTLSLGASRIELGENGRLLSDPYFPKHQALPAGLAEDLRRYLDFAVRYGELIGPVAPLADVRVRTDPGVWAIARRSPGWLTIGLVNMVAGEEARWDQPHAEPDPRAEVGLEVEGDWGIRRAYWASPDASRLDLHPIDWQVRSGLVQATLPSLECWSIVALEMADGG
jgi:dextranase